MIEALIIDSGPLITQKAENVICEKYFSIPNVFNEIKDAATRNRLETIWLPKIKFRSPKPESVKAVLNAAKKTGDYSVLSTTDIGVVALCYEITKELNNGTIPPKSVNVTTDSSTAKKVKDEKLDSKMNELSIQEPVQTDAKSSLSNDEIANKNDTNTADNNKNNSSKNEDDDDSWSVVRKPNKKHKSKQKQQRPIHTIEQSNNSHHGNRKAVEEKEKINEDKTTSIIHVDTTIEDKNNNGNDKNDDINESNKTLDDESKDNEEKGWIGPDNIVEVDQADDEEELDKNSKNSLESIKCGLATSDFAMQNVALYMGLELINAASGRRIKKVKSYMLRCHACFTLVRPSTDSVVPLQFCPNCGSPSLLRVSVSVSAKTGKLYVHLKKNMHWSHRGQKFSLPNPQSKKFRKNGTQTNDLLLREDQKEYMKAIKNEEWRKRTEEKKLSEWFGDGAGPDVFALTGNTRDAFKKSGVHVGKGKYVNSNRRK